MQNPTSTPAHSDRCQGPDAVPSALTGRRALFSRGAALFAGSLVGGCGTGADDSFAASPGGAAAIPDARRIAPPAAYRDPASQLPTTVRLSIDPTLVSFGKELVTFGLPLAPGLISSTKQIRVSVGGAELPISCAEGLRWHWKDNSLRSVSIQCVVDMGRGDVLLTIDASGRNTSTDLPWQPIDKGWTDSGFKDLDGRTLRSPRVLALHDLNYVADSGLLPPYLPPTSEDPASIGISATARNFLESFPYAGKDYSAWLFDRPTTLFKLSLQITDLATRKQLLKHAAISKRHYFNYVVRTQYASTPEWIADHWWDFKRRAEDPNTSFTYGTTMYQYCQGAKLAWALLGDDTQWTTQMLLSWAANIRRAPGTPGQDYVSQPEYKYPASWNERLSGLCSLFHLNAWEITGDHVLRTNLDQRVANLRAHQQTRKPHEIENGWPLSPGVFRHSWAGHDTGETPDYVAKAIRDYPAGATTITVTTDLSDFDVPRYVGKGFNIAGTSGLDLVESTKNPDGTWTWRFDKPLLKPIGPTSGIHTRTNTKLAPYVESDQVFSPWMSVFIADYLWHQYHLIGNPEIPEMLRRLGNAINEYGFLSRINENLTFTRDITSYGGNPWRGFNRAGMETFPLYLCSDIAPRNVLYHAAYTDLHTEMIFPLAAARQFETNPARQRRLEARLRKLEHGLFHEAAVFAANPYRTLNWQHQAMPFRTWKWVERNMES